MKKSFIKWSLFLIITVTILIMVNRVFRFKYTDGIYGWSTFYSLPENTVDVLVLGSSHAFQNINPAVLYEEYGIAAYDLCGSVQPIWNTYYYLKEALKTQRPQLIILEAYCLSLEIEYSDDSRIIKNTYGMKWSRNKLEAIQASAPAEDKTDFLIGPLQYHGRYKDLNKTDWLPYLGNEGQYKYWKGFWNNMNTTSGTMPDILSVNETIELEDKIEMYYRQIIELVITQDIPLLVVVSPYMSINKSSQSRYLKAADIAKEYGIPFINYNTEYTEIGLDSNTDFADGAHLNYLGNRKYTKYLGNYLMENYILSDRRGELGYESWDMNLKYYTESLYGKELLEYTNLKDYLEHIPVDDCVTVITGTEDVTEEHMDGGFCGVWVRQEEETLYFDNSSEEVLWYSDIDDMDFAVKRLVQEDGNEERYIINVGLEEYQKVDKGINIVIYNTFTQELVDAVGFDAEEGYGMVREDPAP